MLNAMFTMIRLCLKFMLFCLKFGGAVALPFVLSFIFWNFYMRFFKKKKKRKRLIFFPKAKQKPLLLRLLVDFPRQVVTDRIEADPEAFTYSGIHIFCGEQGSGKTISAVEFCQRIKRQYPESILKTNTDISFADKTISDVNDVISCSNGVYGEITFLDEIQNWFASNESRNFPPEMLSEVCQQRKQRKILVATSQVFTRLAKPIREQCTLLYLPMTFMGVLTIVRVYKPKLNSEAELKKLRPIKTYCFIQSKELRESYDTYKKIDRLINGGFKKRSEQPYDNKESVFNVTIAGKP